MTDNNKDSNNDNHNDTSSYSNMNRSKNAKFNTEGLASAEMPPIKKGDKLPSVTLYEALPENQMNILNLVANKKAIIFGVPGAFVPGCSRVHLRGFIEK
ncbi:hypothetical protein E2986_13310 [Frieseomelitta varia]|uniref:Redoxin domain-containing protein n=1 Tax=Frieseomelitta varia TaxID=561572 RepID=A0A833SNQ5_9HYME|nr:hypothetical protein E2986_13310 [Frieseomelitta varia]